MLSRLVCQDSEPKKAPRKHANRRPVTGARMLSRCHRQFSAVANERVMLCKFNHLGTYIA